MPRICFICPTYEKFAYAREAIKTFFEYTDDGFCLLVDDASREWAKTDWNAFFKGIPREKVAYHHFETNGGLTRSWNHGLRMARDRAAEYTICGNSDILFTENWHERMTYHLENTPNLGMVGPLSNAPGITAKGRQEIKNYFKGFSLTDDQDYLNCVAKHIYKNRPEVDLDVKTPAGVNGFFLMAKTRTWWSFPFDKRNCFKPRNDKNSKGRRNPTPLMTLNEDELQRRWMNHGFRSGIVLSSFIFHYRAVSRGDKYKRGQWYRMGKK